MTVGSCALHRPSLTPLEEGSSLVFVYTVRAVELEEKLMEEAFPERREQSGGRKRKDRKREKKVYRKKNQN